MTKTKSELWLQFRLNASDLECESAVRGIFSWCTPVKADPMIVNGVLKHIDYVCVSFMYGSTDVPKRVVWNHYRKQGVTVARLAMNNETGIKIID